MLKCESCEFYTKWTNRLKSHQDNNHLSIRCTVCNQGFSKKRDLTRHMKIEHADEALIDSFSEQEIGTNLYQCKFCAYSTKYKSNLRNHEKSCNKTVACDHCDFVSTKKLSLKEHIYKKHPGNLHKCDSCDFYTTLPRVLNYHMNWSHATLKCHVCDQQFKKKTHLKVHIETLHADDVINCTDCDFSGTPEGLKKHKGFNSELLNQIKNIKIQE